MNGYADITIGIPLLAGIAAPFVLIYLVIFFKLRRKLSRVTQAAQLAERNAELVEGYRAEHREDVAALRADHQVNAYPQEFNHLEEN